MLRRILTAAIALTFILALACGSNVRESNGTLPVGMEYDLLPDVEYQTYLYFSPASPVNIDHERLLSPDQSGIIILDSDDGLELSRVSMVAASLDQFGGFLRFTNASDALLAASLLERAAPDEPTSVRVAADTVEVVRGDTVWAVEVRRQFDGPDAPIPTLAGSTLPIPPIVIALPQPPIPPVPGATLSTPPIPPVAGALARLRDRNPNAWNMLTNLPVSVEDPPVAAGFISTGGDLLQTVANEAGVSAPGLSTAFGMARVDNVAFGIYSSMPEMIPNKIDAELLDSLHTGIVLVGGTGYNGLAVSFLIRSIAGKTGMETIDLGRTNARYLKLENGHLLLKNKGSLVYVTASGSRAKAEELMARALR